jgi:hypothetical protein
MGASPAVISRADYRAISDILSPNGTPSEGRRANAFIAFNAVEFNILETEAET